MEQDEDVLSYALFDHVAIDFFKKRRAAKYGLDADNADIDRKIHSV